MFPKRHARQCTPGCLADELDARAPGKAPTSLAAAEKLRNRLAALVAVILRQLVDVHADELVGETDVEPAAVLERILERLVA